MPAQPPEDISRLEALVRSGDSRAIIPYVTARVLGNYSELRGEQDKPRFMMGVLGEKGMTPEAVAGALYPHVTGASPEGRQNIARQTGAAIYANAAAEVGNANQAGGNTQTIVQHGKPAFSLTLLNPTICTACAAEWEKDPRSCDIKTPASQRLQHVAMTGIAEHESAHVVDAFLGFTSQRASRIQGATPEWYALAGENYAHTYEALRLVQIFGSEAKPYIQSLLDSHVKMAAENGVIGHWSVSSFRHVLDYADKHPELSTLPARQMAELANQLSDPPSPAQLQALNQALADPQRNDTAQASQRFNDLVKGKSAQALANELGKDDTQKHARLLAYYAPDYNQRLAEAGVDLARLNPQRPESFTPEQSRAPTGEWTNDQIADLARLNSASRKPDCPPVKDLLQPAPVRNAQEAKPQ